MRKYTTLDIKTIRDNYPKSVEAIGNWMFSADKQLEDAPLFVPTKEGIEETVNITLTFNPRLLFDFFDDQSIFISIYRNEHRLFTYYVSDESFVAENRNDAEIKAITLAFQELEKRL